ncbi:MAG: hypothetical protein QF890_15300 [Myxococcota bacterium]|nr:hypothetical protein [Deltaproteobacteria bacterium]MCP4241831.1 hypothetical protein [bacterium]MDP6074593.1 hypothetical protein [Myxococcota bacterium]MDP6243423.1 hypothetical protein [Myxococcota bacterium]MDP7076064.1 hypothetical protein [Myxococcota bacterium]
MPRRMVLAVIALLGVPDTALADLGVLVADGTAGPYRVSVLVAPAPLRVGVSRWSVLVQDASGNPVDEAEVSLAWNEETGHGVRQIQRFAEPGAHPFFRSSEVDLPTATRWRVVAGVRGPEGPGELDFDAIVAPGPGTWQAYWPALLLPFVSLGLFALHQSLRLRGRGFRR